MVDYKPETTSKEASTTIQFKFQFVSITTKDFS